MSMLSSMCERLRNIADNLSANGYIDAVRELRDAADTIDYLRCTCNDLQVENEKLRNAMWNRANARAIDLMTEDELRGLCSDLYDHIDELKALVRDMSEEIEAGGFDPMVERQGKRGVYYEEDPSWRVGIRERMRELGIEMSE